MAAEISLFLTPFTPFPSLAIFIFKNISLTYLSDCFTVLLLSLIYNIIRNNRILTTQYLSIHLAHSLLSCIFVFYFWTARVNCSLKDGRVGMEFPGIPAACSEAGTEAGLHSLLAATLLDLHFFQNQNYLNIQANLSQDFLFLNSWHLFSSILCLIVFIALRKYY